MFHFDAVGLSGVYERERLPLRSSFRGAAIHSLLYASSTQSEHAYQNASLSRCQNPGFQRDPQIPLKKLHENPGGTLTRVLASRLRSGQAGQDRHWGSFSVFRRTDSVESQYWKVLRDFLIGSNIRVAYTSMYITCIISRPCRRLCLAHATGALRFLSDGGASDDLG